jgi:hypothetical protein
MIPILYLKGVSTGECTILNHSGTRPTPSQEEVRAPYRPDK